MSALQIRKQASIIFLGVFLISPLSCYPVEGVNEDYSIPDSVDGAKLSRKDLCPPDKTSSSFRFHNATKACYKLGEKGPCGKNMVWHSDVNSTVFGECDCDFLFAKIPLVYHPKTDQCYQIYTQAYCEPNQWLTFSNFDPVCVEDRCGDVLLFDPEDSAETTMVEFNGKCVQLYSKNSACKSDHVVTFLTDQVIPTCGRIDDNDEYAISMRSVYRTRSLSCKPGSRRDVHGKCRRTIIIKPSSGER